MQATLRISSDLARLSMSRFDCRYSPLSLEIVEKPNKCKFFGSHFYGRYDPNFSTDYGRLLAGHTDQRLAKFGRVPFADLRLRSLAMKWNAEFTEGGSKLTPILKPFVDQSLCRFEMM